MKTKLQQTPNKTNQLIRSILYYSILMLISTLATYTPGHAQSWQWMHSFGGGVQGPNTNDRDEIRDLTTDRWGNAYVAGMFYHSVDVGSFHLDVPPQVDLIARERNGYVAKVDCDGNVQWISHWKGAGGTGVTKMIAYKDYLYVWGGVGTGQNYPAYIDDSLMISGGFFQNRGYIVKYDIFTGEKLAIIAAENIVPRAIDKVGNFYFSYSLTADLNFQGVNIPAGVGLIKTDNDFNYVQHVVLCEGCNSMSAGFNDLKIDDLGNYYVATRSDSTVHLIWEGQITPDYENDHAISHISKFDNSFNLLWYTQNNTIGTSSVGGIGEQIFIGENGHIFAKGSTKACFGTNYNSCCVLQNDTMKTLYSNETNSFPFTLGKINTSTGLIDWVKRLDQNRISAFHRFGNDYGNISSNKDTLFFSGSLYGGNFYWDTSTISYNGLSYALSIYDSLGNLLGIEIVPYENGNGVSSVQLNKSSISSNNTIYWAGHQNYQIFFPDSTLYPLWGAGSNRDIWVAQYGNGGPCFRCDSIAPAFVAQQYLGNSATVTANNTLYADSYFWDFGFGQTSTEAVPSVAINYPDTGMYQICLTARSFCDSVVYCQNVHIGCPPPLAMDYNYTTGNNSLQITDMSIAQYDSYTWHFGDGTSAFDSLPYHAYANPGTYEVCLEVENTCGLDSLCQTINIQCATPAILSWQYLLDSFAVTATFVEVNNYDSVAWHFGDGTTNTNLFANHTYATEGIYNICFTAFNICGDTTVCENVNILGTGIVHLTEGGSIKVYPNPVQNKLNIELEQLQSGKIYQLEIYDISGRRMLREKLTETNKQIDVSQFSSGMYYLHFTNKKESYKVAVVKE